MTETPRRTRGVQSGPRSRRVVASVRAAVLAELGRVGWAGLTMDGVAQAAGVHRTTVYRRWPTRVDLVTDVVVARLERLEAPAPTGSLPEALDALLARFAEDLLAPEGQALTAVLGAADPELAALGEEAHERTRAVFEGVFDEALARGEVPPEADVAMAAHLAFAGIVQWVLTRGRAPTDPERARLVRAVVTGLATSS